MWGGGGGGGGGGGVFFLSKELTAVFVLVDVPFLRMTWLFG